MSAPLPINVSDFHFLSGCFEPIGSESDYADLHVSYGEVPKDLHGAYLRNGANPRFTPLGSYVYPFEGDAMVHATYFEDGRVRYRNRFLRTPMLKAEEDAGKALWGGLLTGYVPGADIVGAGLANSQKDLPSINVVRHGGRVLALAEASRSYRITEDLDTLDPETYDGAFPFGFCAHPKVDPVTGEMVIFRYNFWEPFLQWAVVGADGNITSGPHPVPGVDRAYMVHDFVITKTKVVLVVNPAYFDLNLLLNGGSPVQWQPDLGSRIAVIPRDASTPPVWHTTEPSWTWHYGNAYDDGDDVVFEGVQWNNLGIDLSEDSSPSVGEYVRTRVGPTGVRQERVAADHRMEFPRIDDRLVGQRHQQVALGANTGRREIPEGQFDAVLALNPDSGATAMFDAGDLSVGEPCFVPPGYYVTYAINRRTYQSHLLILPADDVSAGPVAVLDIPTRVPLGLHGAWLPA